MGPPPVEGATSGDAVTAAWPSFSLLFFASQPAAFQRGKFDLFRETTQFADRHGFEAVWIPERHFHAFGGIFPNPALAGVVLAETTERIRIRAGSVVMPLHHPIRVAEEWAVVDNLSEGRVDVSFAVGWNPNDFARRLGVRAQGADVRGIETVRRLWGGASDTKRSGPDHARDPSAPAPGGPHGVAHLLGRAGALVRGGPTGSTCSRCCFRGSTISARNSPPIETPGCGTAIPAGGR